MKTARLTPKILTYYFNAYVDAQMAEEAVQFTKTGKTASSDTVAAQRVEQLMKSGKHPAGIAYTLYYANGLANYLYAKSLSKLLVRKKTASLSLIHTYNQKLISRLSTTELFQEYRHAQTMLWLYWPLMAINSRRWFSSFCRDRGIDTGYVSKEVLVAAALEVQHQNSAWNHQIKELLLSDQPSDNPKVVLLRTAALQTENPQDFLRRCAHTQVAAARWDKVYRKLLGE